MTEHGRAEATVAAYVEGWNTADDDERRALFESCWAPEAVYVDPATEFAGVDALTSGCRAFASRWPGARIELVGGIQEHHGYASFSWCVRGADGAVLRDGIDFAELGADGRLNRIVGFFGTPPWKPS